MKLLLLLFCCFFYVGAKAQGAGKDSLLRKMVREKLWNNSPMVFQYDGRVQKIMPSGRDAGGRLLPGVHHLPQDGMVCFVPDTKDIAAIPNGYKGKTTVPFTGPRPGIPKPLPAEPLPFRYKKSAPVLPKN